MRKLLLSLSIVLSAAHGAYATWVSFNGGQCSYNTPYDMSSGACELIYTTSAGYYGYSKCAFNPNPSGAVTLPAKLGGKSLVRIGDYAFYKCTGVTSVTLPASVTDINRFAFEGCTSLTNVVLPKGLVTLGYEAFFNCSNLRSVTLPDSFKNDGRNQFAGCASGFKLYANTWEHWMDITVEHSGYRNSILSYPGDITLYLNGKAVTDLSDMPSSVRGIRNRAFAGYTRFKIDRLPSTVTNVGEYAFADCTNIDSFDFSAPGITWGFGAFWGTKLDNVTLPDWMTATPAGLFYGCSSLKTVTLPKDLKRLSASTFKDCSSLETVSLPETLTSIGDYALESCRLSVCDIPQSVTNIGCSALSENRSLTRMTLPDGLRELNDRLLYYCVSLRKVDIPQGVTNIGVSCFYQCRSLKDLTIPAGVRKIGYSAFEGCRALTNVTFHGVNPAANNSSIYTGTPTNLLTTVMGYDVSWSNALAVGTWKYRPIVCIDDWPVRFDLGDKGVRTGGGELTQSVRTYGAATAPTVASTDEDYVFSGWDRSFSDIRFFTTVKALYTPKAIALKGSSAVSMMRFDDSASIQLAALGGVKPYTWSVVSGLPAGLSISAGGVISGNTATLGTATVKVRVTDSRNVAATLTYTLTVTENTNLKPVVDALNPTSSPVLGRGATNTLVVTAHDPEGKALAYRWFVDGVEEKDASGASFDFADADDGVLTHTVRCVIEDPVWKLGYTTETNWTVRTLTEPVISSPEGTLFGKGTGTVSIVCNIPEAEIFYAIDFSPRLTDRFRYAGPFMVGTSCVVRAIARCGTYLTDYVSASFTCATPAFSDPVGAGSKVQFSTGGDADWAPDGDSLRSGAVGPEGESWLRAVCEGKGTFSFKWKTDCEHDIDEACSWDALEVYVDGSSVRFDAIDDVSDWTAVEIPIAEKGDHEILWRFVRDDYDEDGVSFQNCGWITDVRWRGSLLPELALSATEGEVSEALADASDARLKAHVTTAERYGRFRTWALGVDAAGEGENVLAHSRAWMSFALAQPSLLESDLTDADLKVKSFATVTSGSGAFTLTASVGDLTIPSTANSDDLAELIGVAGASTLDQEQFSFENVSVTFGTPVEGKLSLTVAPNGTPSTFFLRLGVKYK